ncbi:probable C-mannosyltransferase DPY19L1 [Ruditapes philippinarum]|uniref:probable C-mannosyltransferase DPY19L1 n=1 Tax=Ruditapes philippinarum TaxID=129788 RepID=UPI00295BCB50|nr:probable C-mannosyltransferase DPY19L1 [Ruditapes philippinarum]
MAAKKRNAQSTDASNGKSSSSKATNRPKLSGKAKSKDDEHSKRNANSVLYKICLFALALVIGFCHRNHIANMFERDRHFSHLSTLERELAFRTEMGLYYSYYKTMIESPTFTDGLYQVMNDNITEFPLTINTLKRFNLYPEVALAIGYRAYEAINAAFNRPTKMCWRVNRGEGLSPVQSCEGLGEPSYFYVEHVFILNGMMMSIFFLFGTYLSGSMFGGILTVASFFFNHGEATRVQWTPPLRESFAYPFLVIQMFLVTHLLRTSAPTFKHSLPIAIATILFMLPWQFAQFALLTEMIAVFATYVLGYIGSRKMKVFLLGIGSGFIVSYVLLFGNEMLLTSFFFSGLLTITSIVYIEPVLETLRIRPLIWISQGAMLGVGTVGFKFVVAKLFSIEDDAHIGDIFRSKFSDFKNFHTMLYTCAAEFDFMEAETPGRILKTLLAPAVLIVLVTVTYQLLKTEYNAWVKTSSEPGKDLQTDIPNRSKPNAEVVYHFFQLIAFTMMAVIIMRLKLFWTPHLCLMTSLLASRQFFGWLGSKEKQYAILTALLAGMTVQGLSNLQHQWSILGEFSNMPLEELVEWTKAKTPTNAVFAGPMPTMATIKLCTGRPIVNHPHYEDAGLRERTKKVYTMYSRKPLAEVKKNLLALQADYAILEDSWCVRRSRQGCSMAEIWDIEDEENRGETTPACTKMKDNPGPHFKTVFKNNVYQVLKVLK